MITVSQARELAQSRLQANLGKWLEPAFARPQVLQVSQDDALPPSSIPVPDNAPSLSATPSNDTAPQPSNPLSAGTASSPSAAPLLSIALRPPTEKQMLADQRAAQAWAAAWEKLRPSPGITVDWKTRQWRSIGRQRIPVRLHLANPHAVAAFGGGEPALLWQSLFARASTLLMALAGTPEQHAGILGVIRKHATTVLGYSEAEFSMVGQTSRWLIDTPVVGLRPRQVGIRGVDSKWFTAHRAVLTDLVQAISGSADLGIVNSDPLVRMRILDPQLLPGAPQDFAASPLELAALPLSPTIIYVFENLESVLTMPAIPGGVVLHGGGYAVDLLSSISWLHSAPVWYWGDLDSHGFAILNQLRSYLPQARSVLMDTLTLESHADLWVPEPKPHTGQFTSLTDSESATLMRLRELGNVRLEQERIPWDYAQNALEHCRGEAARFLPLNSP